MEAVFLHTLLQPEHYFETHSASVSWLCYTLTYLCPFLVPALHLDRGDSCKHFICWQVLRQPGQKLGTVDEVHPGQDILKKLQDAQSCAEEKFLSISTEYIPDAASQVQGQGLTVQGEDPGETGFQVGDQIRHCTHSTLSPHLLHMVEDTGLHHSECQFTFYTKRHFSIYVLSNTT